MCALILAIVSIQIKAANSKFVSYSAQDNSAYLFEKCACCAAVCAGPAVHVLTQRQKNSRLLFTASVHFLRLGGLQNSIVVRRVYHFLPALKQLHQTQFNEKNNRDRERSHSKTKRLADRKHPIFHLVADVTTVLLALRFNLKSTMQHGTDFVAMTNRKSKVKVSINVRVSAFFCSFSWFSREIQFSLERRVTFAKTKKRYKLCKTKKLQVRSFENFVQSKADFFYSEWKASLQQRVEDVFRRMNRHH